MARTPPTINITANPQFKVIHVTGFFGGLNPDEGSIKFFLDIFEPRLKAGGAPGEMEVDRVTREMQVEVRMSARNWLSMTTWMDSHIKRLEKDGLLKREKKPSKKENSSGMYT